MDEAQDQFPFNASSAVIPSINRRGALKVLASSVVTSVAASALPLAALGQVSGPKWKTAIGLNGFQSGSHKYHKNYPIWEVLDFASRHGFEGVELVGDWPSGGYPSARETERVRALRRLYDSFGLRIFSIQLGADGAFDPTKAGRKAWLEQFRDHAQLAKALGCDCVGLWPGGGLRSQTIDQAITTLAQTFHEAGKIASDLALLRGLEGVTLRNPLEINAAASKVGTTTR